MTDRLLLRYGPLVAVFLALLAALAVVTSVLVLIRAATFLAEVLS